MVKETQRAIKQKKTKLVQFHSLYWLKASLQDDTTITMLHWSNFHGDEQNWASISLFKPENSVFLNIRILMVCNSSVWKMKNHFWVSLGLLIASLTTGLQSLLLCHRCLIEGGIIFAPFLLLLKRHFLTQPWLILFLAATDYRIAFSHSHSMRHIFWRQWR